MEGIASVSASLAPKSASHMSIAQLSKQPPPPPYCGPTIGSINPWQIPLPHGSPPVNQPDVREQGKLLARASRKLSAQTPWAPAFPKGKACSALPLPLLHRRALPLPLPPALPSPPLAPSPCGAMACLRPPCPVVTTCLENRDYHHPFLLPNCTWFSQGLE